MSGLPKRYAKMGFKKGWRAFKASKNVNKSKSLNNYKTTRRVSIMARRKTRAKKRSYSRSNSGISNLTNLVIGAAGAYAYENYLAPMIPINRAGVQGDIIDFAAGYALTKFGKNKYLTATGNAIMVINAYSAMNTLIGKKSTNTSVGQNGIIYG